MGFVAGATVSWTLVWWWNLRNKKQAQAAEAADESETAVPRGGKSFSGGSSLPPGDVVSGGALSNFPSDLIRALWSHMDAFLSNSIRESVEPMLAQSLPKPFSSMRFTKLSFGRTPLHFDNIVIHREETVSTVDPTLQSTPVIKLDLDVVWEAQCEIELQAPLVGTLGLRQFTLVGRLCLLLHPMDDAPLVSAVQCSFVNPPIISLDFTGLAQLADLGIVKSRLLASVQDSLASTMVLPQRTLVKLDPTTRYLDLYAPPRGVLRLTLQRGTGFQIQKAQYFGRDDIVDVYCILSLGNKTWTSQTIDNNLEPVWNEKSDFVYHELDQEIQINLWDRDQGTLDSDDHLGVAKLTVRQALEATLPPNRTISVQVFNNWKEQKATGITLTVSVENLALTENLSSLQGFAPHCVCGVLEVLVLGARDLAVPKEEAASFVRVVCGKFNFVTPTIATAPGIDGLNPAYDCSFVLPLEHPKDLCDVVFTLCNAQQVLGSYTVTSDSIQQLPDRTLVTSVSVGNAGASLEFCVCLRGVEPDAKVARSLRSLAKPLSPSSPAATASPPARTRALPSSSPTPIAPARPPSRSPVGTIRLTAVQGFGFKVQRRRFRKADVPDVYCKIHCGDPSNVWRTNTVRDSVNPEWNQSQTFPLYDVQDTVVIEVYDEDSAKLDADEHIGSARVSLSKLLTDSATRPSDVAIKRDGKGTVAFVALKAERLSGR